MTDLQTRRDSLDAAIDKAGGIMTFCKALGVTHQAVYAWKKRGAVPLERASIIEVLYHIPRAAVLDPRITRALEMPSAGSLL